MRTSNQIGLLSPRNGKSFPTVHAGPQFSNDGSFLFAAIIPTMSHQASLFQQLMTLFVTAVVADVLQNELRGQFVQGTGTARFHALMTIQEDEVVVPVYYIDLVIRAATRDVNLRSRQKKIFIGNSRGTVKALVAGARRLRRSCSSLVNLQNCQRCFGVLVVQAAGQYENAVSALLDMQRTDQAGAHIANLSIPGGFDADKQGGPPESGRL